MASALQEAHNRNARTIAARYVLRDTLRTESDQTLMDVPTDVRERSIIITRGESQILTRRTTLTAQRIILRQQGLRECHRVAAIATIAIRARRRGKASSVRPTRRLHRPEVLIQEREVVAIAAVAEIQVVAHHVLHEEIRHTSLTHLIF